MDERLVLIELFEGLTGPQNDDGQMQNALMERCLKASKLELKEFFDELSQIILESPKINLPILKTFISYFKDESIRVIRRRNLQYIVLVNFSSMLITSVIMKILYHSDFPDFGELLYNCVESLWKGLIIVNNNNNNNNTSYNNNLTSASSGNNQIKLTIKQLFTKIVETRGVLGVLISESPGRRFLKQILFNYNIIDDFDQKDLLKAVDMIAILLDKCTEHKDISTKLSEAFSIYKSCNALLESLKNYQNIINNNIKNDGKHSSLPPDLYDMIKIDDSEGLSNVSNINRKRSVSNPDVTPFSSKDEQHLLLLKMKAPQKKSDLSNFSKDLEKRKINSFKDLIGFFPCKNCHKISLVQFSPEKYSSILEVEKDFDDVENTDYEQTFRLPFEFDDSDNLGPWDILLSEDAIKDMQKLESPIISKSVMKKLGNISSGLWDKHGFKRLESFKNIPVYLIELPENDLLKILWQVDYGFSIRCHSLTQLVKVWSVSKNVDKTLENLELVHKVYLQKHNYRFTIQQSRGGIILPKIFDDEEGIKSTNDGLCGSEMDDERLLEVHKMLVTNKFIPLSKNLFKSLVMGGSGFTFNVSKIEYEIINHPTSTIIVGRSGTGKTTCIAFRLVASYLNNKISKPPSLRGINSNNNNGNIYKRQLFITVSPNLCLRVKKYFDRLRESAEFAGRRMSLADFNEFARMREEGDGDVGTDDNMFEEGDEEKEFGHIRSFRDLTDEHFPLFITYDKFSKMLQETYGVDIQKCAATKQKFNNDDINDDDDDEFHSRTSFVDNSHLSWDMHFVDYDVFYDRYWRHFSDYYTKKLDCELVYSEFFVIKGTDPDVEYLSRDEYREISIKKFPVFQYNRDEVYDLFERYEKMKARHRDYDPVDRTLAILRASKVALGGPNIHEVYIDECQDNQIVDLALILKLFNRADNVFMAGDIAQCIARGSSFRFQNLSTLMYKWELERNQNKRKSLAPKQFELNVNYRSHSGILRLASSVIDLIHRFFPDSIDSLSRERSEIGGPRPIVFKGFRSETFLFDVFSVDEQMADCIEFGAEQVIIVRDEKAKKSVGNVGIVMTVFEAKGMEFNDVLLYNFFTDSPARLKWRVILSELDDYSKGIQTFSHEKHYILSSELKHLYVAVTRAKQHLWIFDDADAEFSDPIRIYWEHNELVKVIQSLEELGTLPTLVKKSSSHEWNRKGRTFFERRQYELAMFCFSKGESEEGYKLAYAYDLQRIARASVNNSSETTIKDKFISASESFEKCSRPIQAASCYQDIGMNKDAGDVYFRWDMFDDAAPCYLKDNLWEKAGECYEMAEKYTDAIVAYKSGSLYKKVIDLMQKHRDKIDEKIFRRITRFINIHYRRENNEEMSKEALSVLSTHEERIELLREHAPDELLKVCEESGRFCDAGKDLCSRGKFKEATDMFIRSKDEDDIIEALQCLLYLCRIKVLNIITNTMNQSITQELENIHIEAMKIIDTVQLSKTSKRLDRWKIIKEELQLYSAYLKNELDEVNKCIQSFRKNGEFDNEFRSIIIWLQIEFETNNNYSERAEYWRDRLQHLMRICELTYPYICIVTRPQNNQNTKNITKIYKDIENTFFVCKVENRHNKRQILFEHPFVEYQNISEDSKEIVDNWHIYNIYEIRQTILQHLASYIFELIYDTNLKGREIPNISSQFCKYPTTCARQDCYFHHVIPNPSIIQQRSTLACLQYAVIQQWELLYHRRLLSDEQAEKVRPAQRFWGENLIKIHFRYQSPQTSCPEVTYMIIDGLSNHTCNGLLSLARKIWLRDLYNNPGNFAVMLKCIFVFHQLRYDWGFDELNWMMSDTIQLLHPNNLPDGYDYYYGRYEAIPVGKRLSLFFNLLYSNRVTKAISQLKRFTQYALIRSESVNMNTSDALGDLISLIEFKVSLIFATGPGYCDFCIPRSYLVNYFDVFTAEPLIPNRYGYKRDYYCSELKDSLEQIQRLLELLIFKERKDMMIILRLIRLLVLIGRNESTFSFKVSNLFKSLNRQFTTGKIKKYLEESHILSLVNILKDDLKETDCDSLVIVHYHWGGLSRFSELERSGVPMLKYKSIEEFHSRLKSMSPVVNEEKLNKPKPLSRTTDVNKQNNNNNNNNFRDEDDDDDDDDDDDEQFSVSKEDSEPATWFHQIQNSIQAKESAKKIQDWFRKIYERSQLQSQQDNRDQTFDKIYNDSKDFCRNSTYWEIIIEQKGESEVRKYHMLLRGLTVDMIVNLIKYQDKMDKIKRKLQKTINDRSTNDDMIEICLNLEDDLKYIHYENVKLVLESLSMTEDSTSHRAADIQWLKGELKKAKNIIDEILKWMNECKTKTSIKL